MNNRRHAQDGIKVTADFVCQCATVLLDLVSLSDTTAV